MVVRVPSAHYLEVTHGTPHIIFGQMTCPSITHTLKETSGKPSACRLTNHASFESIKGEK